MFKPNEIYYEPEINAYPLGKFPSVSELYSKDMMIDRGCGKYAYEPVIK